MKKGIDLRLASISFFATALFAFSANMAQASLLNISQKPLVLSDSVAPNLILTLDDSGSMRWAFVPDNISNMGHTRRVKSATFNPMYYDPSVTYRVPIRYNTDGSVSSTPYSTSFERAWNNGYNPGGSEWLNLSNDYKVSWTYSLSDPLPTQYGISNTTPRLAQNPSSEYSTRERTSGVQAYYYVHSGAPTCPVTLDDCYRLVKVTATSGEIRQDDPTAGRDERQNFAIWYSFYRNRALATISAANLSFSNLPPAVRVTWQALNDCKLAGNISGDRGCGQNFLAPFSSAHKGNFFSWLPGISFNGGTPLHQAMNRAGSFLNQAAAWREDPKNAKSISYSCRPSYHVMMTDGMWSSADVRAGNLDGSSFNLPDNTAYRPIAPYQDSQNDTLADLALYYWARDLQPDLKNNLKPVMPVPSAGYWDPRNNPATWQHMVNYTIGLGLGKSLNKPGFPWTGETYGGPGYNSLFNGGSWPAVSEENGKVYDLWHAAVNSRGEFFNGDSPDKVVEAFNQILNRIGNYTTSASRPAVTASVVSNDTSREVYETEFSSADWSGDLKRYNVNNQGSRTLVWSAKSLLTASRNVRMANAAGSSFQDFTWDNLTTEQKALLDTNPQSLNGAGDGRGQARVGYIRGARDGEGTGPSDFRARSSVLGDIVNSSPVVVRDAQYVPYLADRIDGASGTYAAFAQRMRSRTPVVYVGANDGMLHGFNAETGQETFAFIPTAVLPNLNRLTGQNYQSGGHRFYVDGTPVVSDVYFNNAWRTVLVGTLRGGGKSLFALDVTDPANVKLLWEFSHPDMGYTFPTPSVARLNNGKWAVITGNGYGNQTGTAPDKAALFVLDVATGAQLTPKATPIVVSGDTTKANGLSSVRLADNNSDGIADYAYAGDLQGNLWRFDLFAATATNTDTTQGDTATDPFASAGRGISVSYGGKPLFTAKDAAGNPQAITAAPSLVRHPTRLGYLVIFGTGKYFEDSDGSVDTTRVQSLYGIWDRRTAGQQTSSPPTITRANLLEQTINTQSDASFSDNNAQIRTISQNLAVWYRTDANGTTNSDVLNWGWRMDLTVNGQPAGEMMINPLSVRGETVLFNTLTPNDDPCQDGVEGWLYGINPTSGARTTFNVFDLNGNGQVDSNDSYEGNVVSGNRLDSAGGFTLNGDIVFSTGESMRVNFGPTSNGRQTWQLIPCDEDDEENGCVPEPE